MFKYRIDEKENVIFLVFEGEILAEDYEQLIRDIVVDENFKNSPRILIDQSNGRMSIPSEKVQSHPHFLKNMQNELGLPKVAVVVGSDLDYGINRMFEAYSEGTTEFEGKVFRNMSEAKNWLNIIIE